ncbi:MAG: glycoside hydrolase family 3 C-terminal domain-containing protein, partial [Lacisediminihabitans sp.]
MPAQYSPPAALSVEEKATLVVGSGFWHTAAVPGIRSIMVADGPHGLRKQAAGGDHLGIGVSVPATCFPPAVALASTFNTQLVERVGIALGEEARAEDVAVLLGPGVNIKRSPLCGRNFEYFSEDPLVSGELGAALVRGLQSQGVGASLKHFAANNQETNRMTVSADIDERTLREIYLPAFETIVTREQPWTVMCSYNRLNGVATAESHWLLTTLLREEWGFSGLVVSDWGAVDGRVAALVAGTDLEMPGPQADSHAAVMQALRDGSLKESTLDVAVERVRALVTRASTASSTGETGGDGSSTGATAGNGSSVPVGARVYADRHHELAREAAAESIVLLRNEGGVLPLSPAATITVIGELARSPRIQGAGSSQVNPTRVDNPLEELRTRASVDFAAGYTLGADTNGTLHDEAVQLAARSDVVLLFLGLPEGEESEGYDRTRLDLPQDQLALVAAIAAVNPRTVVVLTNGGVVTLEPWHDDVAGILECWLLGQAGGRAIADVVFGDTNPSGRLAETIPFRLQDTPSFLNFPGDGNVVRYSEGMFVGYRHYETIGLAARYPFGFGLSYTSFGYTDLRVRRDQVSVTVTNTGKRAGKEVVQLYVSAPSGQAGTPLRELRGFTKVTLDPGESRVVSVTLGARAFSYWDVESSAWVVAGGTYEVQLGRSAHDIVLTAPFRRSSTRKEHPLTMESPVSAWLAHPVTGPILRRAAARESPKEGGTSLLEMVGSMPMRRLLRFPGVEIDHAQLQLLRRVANNPAVLGLARGVARIRSA